MHQTECFSLSDGELHYLWWFIQGSFMRPDVRRRLWDGWGFCQRHSCGLLVIESALRGDWLHASTILYADIMRRAQERLKAGRRENAMLHRSLMPRRRCLVCDLGFGPRSTGYAPERLLVRGRDTSNLRDFANQTASHWKEAVCGMCVGSADHDHLCRPHLLSQLSRGQVKEIEAEGEFVRHLAEHLKAYDCSFGMEYRGTETLEDKAALIGAAGWCSGWGQLLGIIG